MPEIENGRNAWSDQGAGKQAFSQTVERRVKYANTLESYLVMSVKTVQKAL